MRWVSIFVFIVSSNLDNLVIGLAYGVHEIKIAPKSNLLIGLLTLLGTLLAMGLGRGLSALLPMDRAGTLGAVLLLGLGLFLLLGYLRKRKYARAEPDWPRAHPEQFDRDGSRNIDLREAALLGLVLTANNMGLGVGASMLGLPVTLTSVGSCLCSLLCLSIGNRAGRSALGGTLGRCAEPLSGVLMILLALWELAA